MKQKQRCRRESPAASSSSSDCSVAPISWFSRLRTYLDWQRWDKLIVLLFYLNTVHVLPGQPIQFLGSSQIRWLLVIAVVSGSWLAHRLAHYFHFLSISWLESDVPKVTSPVIPEPEHVVHHVGTQTKHVDPNFFSETKLLERQYQREIRRLQRRMLVLKRKAAKDFEKRNNLLTELSQSLMFKENRLNLLKSEVNELAANTVTPGIHVDDELARPIQKEIADERICGGATKGHYIKQASNELAGGDFTWLQDILHVIEEDIPWLPADCNFEDNLPDDLPDDPTDSGNLTHDIDNCETH